MMKPTRKQVILIILGLLIVAAVIYGFLPGAVPVSTATAQVSPLQVTVEEEGETYVKQPYTISSPVAAYLHRIDLEPGDFVEKGEALALLGSPRPVFLDSRTRAEARARVTAARASLERAESQEEQAVRARDRLQRLASAESATKEQVEAAQTQAASAIAARKAAMAELKAALVQAGAAANPGGRTVEQVLTAPVSGRILVVHRRSEGPVNAGDPLLEMGDIKQLEVRIDVLSRDAVRIAPGMRVVLEQWGGGQPLEATVSRVESQGKVVVSALGVEERRVRVIAELESSPDVWEGLGSGYRVMAKFIIWEEDEVLQVPASAVFRTGEGWGIFVVEEGKAVRRTIRIGKQSGLAVQVLDGLVEGEKVIVHPDDKVGDGVKVEAI